MTYLEGFLQELVGWELPLPVLSALQPLRGEASLSLWEETDRTLISCQEICCEPLPAPHAKPAVFLRGRKGGVNHLG